MRNDGTVKGANWMILEAFTNMFAIDQAKLRESHCIKLEKNLERFHLYRKVGWNHAGVIQVIKDGSIHMLYVNLCKVRHAIHVH